MQRRFYSAVPIGGGEGVLRGDEAHHIARVLRAGVGDQLVLFDGSGGEFTVELSAIERHEVRYKVLSREHEDRELPIPLHVGVGLPKGDRQKWLIEKAVELGVTTLTPLTTQHGVAQPTAEVLERLRRQVIEASKQCARNRLMTIHPSMSLANFCASAPANATRLMTHPYQAQAMQAVLSRARMQGGVFVVVGPEGGWADDELTQAIQSGWLPVSLGRRILRVETAVCAVAAIMAAVVESSSADQQM